MTPMEEHLAVFAECIERVLEMERQRKEAESGAVVAGNPTPENGAARAAS